MPKYCARRVILALEVLTQNPAPVLQYDVKKLKGLKDTYRIRIGDIRIEYYIAWETIPIDSLRGHPSSTWTSEAVIHEQWEGAPPSLWGGGPSSLKSGPVRGYI